MTIVAAIVATGALAFSPQTVFAPHQPTLCMFPFDDVDGDGFTCDVDPDDHDPLCPILECFAGEPEGFVRDNVDIENIKLEEGQSRVIVDNAGIGGTSDVEITWNFDPDNCMLQSIGDPDGDGMPPYTLSMIPDDGAFSSGVLGFTVAVAHADVVHAEGIILTTAPDNSNDCEIKSDEGNFVAVSTVDSGGPGILIIS